jgi:hypothetical protein
MEARRFTAGMSQSLDSAAKRMMCWLLFVSTFSSIAAAGRDAFGEPTTSKTPVAVVFGDGLEENRRGVVHDLPLELRAEGFEVPIVGKITEGESIDIWAERARSRGVRALIHVFRVSENDSSIEILLVLPDGLRRKNIIRYAPASADAAALSAVEVTRAALLSTVAEPRPDLPSTEDPTIELPAAPSAKPAGPSTHFSIGVFPTFTVTGSTPLVLFNFAGAFSISSDPRFSLDVHGAIPGTSWTEHVVEGSLETRMTWIHIGMTWFVAPGLRWLNPYLSPRIGTLFLSTDATRSSSQNDAAFLGALATGVSLRLVPNVRLRAEAAMGFTSPELLLRVAGTVVDRLGVPLFQFAFGPEFGP